MSLPKAVITGTRALLILALIVPAWIALAIPAAAGTSTLIMDCDPTANNQSLATTTIDQDASFTVEVYGSAGAQTVDGVDVYINFDKTKLKITHIAPNTTYAASSVSLLSTDGPDAGVTEDATGLANANAAGDAGVSILYNGAKPTGVWRIAILTFTGIFAASPTLLAYNVPPEGEVVRVNKIAIGGGNDLDLPTSTGAGITINAGPTHHLTLNAPADVNAGDRAAYTVTRFTAGNNLASSGAQTVYLFTDSTGANAKFYDAAVAGNVITQVTIADTASTANFWYYDEKPGNWTITTSDATPADGATGVIDATDALTINLGPTHHFTLNAPADIIPASRAAYTVTRYDQVNNLVTDGDQTVYLFTDSTGANAKFYDAAVAGNVITQITITDTASSANFWYYDEEVGDWTITASDATPADGATGIIDATDALTVRVPTDHFTLNAPADITAGNRAAYTITRYDAVNALVTTGAQTVYLFTDSTGANAKFYDAAVAGNVITQVTIADTASSANFWYFDEKPGDWTITISDATPADGATGIDDLTDALTVNLGPTHHFTLNAPADIAAGNRAAYTVTRYDLGNNLTTTGAQTVYLFTDSTGTNAKFYDAAVAGNAITQVTIANAASSANFWYYDEKPGNWTITTSDATPADGATGIADATDALTVNVGATDHFTLNTPADITAGNRAAYTVTRYDQVNNLVTTGAQTVYLFTSSTGANAKFYDAAVAGNVITQVTIANGASAANFWYYDEKPGTWTITASDATPAADGATGIDDATDSLTVNVGAAHHYTLSAPADIAPGDRAAYTVTREDQVNNPVTSGAQTVYLYTDSTGANAKFYNAATGGTVITQVTIANGASSASFWYYDETPGDWTITASDATPAADGATGIVDATDALTVNLGATDYFTLNTPADIDAGGRAAYTVTRYDQWDNLGTSGAETVYLFSNSTGANKKFYDAAAGGNVITQVTIADGASTANFWYYDEKAGSWTITVSDATPADGATGIIDATDALTVNLLAVDHFTLNTPADITVGSRAAYTVTRYDLYNNLITSGAQTVYLSTNSTGANAKFYDAATGGNAITSVTIANNASSANFWYYDEKPGNWTTTASDATPADGATGIDDATDSLTVNVGTIHHFTLNEPANITTGTRAAYTVTRYDPFNNLVTTGAQTVYLFTNSTGTTAKFYDAAVAGNVITQVTIANNASSANFWYYDEKYGTWTVTASDATPANGATGVIDDTDSITVIPVITNTYDLGAGWNIFSVPFSLEDGYRSWGEVKAISSATLTSAIAYWYDPSTPAAPWKQVENTYDLYPCDAIYVKMTGSVADAVSVVADTTPSVPSKRLYAGWNLISLALYDTDGNPADPLLSSMPADEALTSIFTVTGGAEFEGYAQLVSPALNQTGFIFLREGAVIPNMVAFDGYWVFMLNGGTLGGFTTTPLPPT